MHEFRIEEHFALMMPWFPKELRYYLDFISHSVDYIIPYKLYSIQCTDTQLDIFYFLLNYSPIRLLYTLIFPNGYYLIIRGFIGISYKPA
jgi:hypothetical protein